MHRDAFFLFEIVIKRSKVTYGHHLNKLGRPWVPMLNIKIVTAPKLSLFWRRSLSVFYQIWAWRLSCSVVRDHLNKLSIPFWQKAYRYEIWWKLLKWFQRRRCLKITQFYNLSKVFMDNGRTDGRQTVSVYNSSAWAFGSGELKIN